MENMIKIKGVCNHQDHAGVGSALPDYLQYYRIGLLKQMGANAYRTSIIRQRPNCWMPVIAWECWFWTKQDYSTAARNI